MTIGSLLSGEQTTPIKGVLSTNDVRTVVANHLGVSVGRVTDEAHFTHDLGVDWLDRYELMIVVEDHFDGVEIADADVNQIEVVGDLIRYIETVDNERRQRGIAPVTRKLFGPRLVRAVNASSAGANSTVQCARPSIAASLASLPISCST
jgi:acyl carrier protein